MQTTWFVISAFQAAALAASMACFLSVQAARQFFTSELLPYYYPLRLSLNLANGMMLVDEVHALQWRAAAMVAELVSNQPLYSMSACRF